MQFAPWPFAAGARATSFGKAVTDWLRIESFRQVDKELKDLEQVADGILRQMIAQVTADPSMPMKFTIEEGSVPTQVQGPPEYDQLAKDLSDLVQKPAYNDNPVIKRILLTAINSLPGYEQYDPTAPAAAPAPIAISLAPAVAPVASAAASSAPVVSAAEQHAAAEAAAQEVFETMRALGLD